MATYLAHPHPLAEISIASDTAVEAVLQQKFNDSWQPGFLLNIIMPHRTSTVLTVQQRTIGSLFSCQAFLVIH